MDSGQIIIVEEFLQPNNTINKTLDNDEKLVSFRK